MTLRVPRRETGIPERHAPTEEVPVDEFQSKLKVFKATMSQDFPEFLVVWCPHEECPSFEQRPFLVHARTWLKRIRRVARTNQRPYAIIGRSCPYCFRTGRIPARAEIG